MLGGGHPRTRTNTLPSVPLRGALGDERVLLDLVVHHHAIDLNVPIGCGDAPVFPGDVILGDADGVIVIPAHLAEEIAAEATEMTAYEDFAAEKVAEGRSLVGLYPATNPASIEEFKVWRAQRGR